MPDLAPLRPLDAMTDAERYPLATYQGQVPPAPDWFRRAMAVAPERSFYEVDGKSIELLTWGEIGQPGLLFLHGSGAHADWWSFIAPFFARHYRCAAISWSGMGHSSWPQHYSLEGYAAEAVAAIDAAGLDKGPIGPILIAHSLGGNPVMIAGAIDDRIAGVICIDTAISPRYAIPASREPQSGRHRLYTKIGDALARFRLDPPQTAENHYIVDHIARHALREDEDQGVKGWSWRFDPSMWSKLDRSSIPTLPGKIRCPMAYMHGGRSRLIDAEIMDFMRGVLPNGTPIIPIPDADHHVLVDQPLAVVATLRGLLASWPPRT